MERLHGISNKRLLRFLIPIITICLALVLVLNTIPVNAFYPAGRWSTTWTEYRTYGWQQGVPNGPFPAGTYDLIDFAATRWSFGQTGINFSIVNYNGIYGPVRTIVDQRSYSQQGWPDWPGQNIIYSSGGYCVFSAIYLNSDWSWAIDGTINQSQRIMDVMTGILHEFGHSVVLGDISSPSTAVMCPNYTIKRSLTQDDKDGIDYYY